MKQPQLSAILAVLLALASMPASSAPDAVPAIDDDEYAVYGAALANLDGVFAIPARGRVILDTTLSERRLDAESIAQLARSGMPPDAAMVEDFNRKNAGGYRIAPGRIPPPFTLSGNWTPAFPGEGSVERLELSRVGFDSERRRAVVVVSHTFRGGQRAFHSSGGYLMLERQDSRWRVLGTAAGWASHY